MLLWVIALNLFHCFTKTKTALALHFMTNTWSHCVSLKHTFFFTNLWLNSISIFTCIPRLDTRSCYIQQCITVKLNSLRPRQHGRLFDVDSLNAFSLIKISFLGLKFHWKPIARLPDDIKSMLVEIMAWRWINACSIILSGWHYLAFVFICTGWDFQKSLPYIFWYQLFDRPPTLQYTTCSGACRQGRAWKIRGIAMEY